MEKYIKEIKGLNKTYISLNEIEEIIKIAMMFYTHS